MRRGMTFGLFAAPRGRATLRAGGPQMTPSRLIGIAGLIAWLVVGLRAFIFHFGVMPGADGRWLAAFLLFGALFAAGLRRPRLLLVGAESATGLALVCSAATATKGSC